jgi:hypothetical protein
MHVLILISMSWRNTCLLLCGEEQSGARVPWRRLEKVLKNRFHEKLEKTDPVWFLGFSKTGGLKFKILIFFVK